MTQPTDLSVNNCPSHCVSLNQKCVSLVNVGDSNSPLLSRIYQELIIPHFSDANDVDSLEAIRRYMNTAKLLSKYCLSYNVVVALDAMGRVVGTTIFGVFVVNGMAFVKGEYTVIAPDARKYGTLEQLLGARHKVAFNECIAAGIAELAFVIIQVYSESTRVEKKAFQRMWRLHGFRRVDFPFVQLPLRDNLGAVTTFDLFIQPLTDEFFVRTYLTPEESHAIVEACSTFRESQKALADYEEYHQMKLFIDQQKRVPICH